MLEEADAGKRRAEELKSKYGQNRSLLLFLQKVLPCYCSPGARICFPLAASNSLQQAFVDTNSMLPGAFVCFTHNSHFSILHAFFIVHPAAMSWLPSGAPRLGSKSLQITGLRVLMEHSAGWSWHIRNQILAIQRLKIILDQILNQTRKWAIAQVAQA